MRNHLKELMVASAGAQTSGERPEESSGERMTPLVEISDISEFEMGLIEKLDEILEAGNTTDEA